MQSQSIQKRDIDAFKFSSLSFNVAVPQGIVVNILYNKQISFFDVKIYLAVYYITDVAANTKHKKNINLKI